MSIINNMPNVGGGMNINGILKDYYVYAGENISAGDLVEFTEGISGFIDLSTYNIATVSTKEFGGIPLEDGRVVIFGTDQKVYVCRIDEHGIVTTTTTVCENTAFGYDIEIAALWENNIVFCVSSSGNDKILRVTFFEVLNDDTVVQLAKATSSNNNMFTLNSYNDASCYRLEQGKYFCIATKTDSDYDYPNGLMLIITFDRDAGTTTIETGSMATPFDYHSGYDNTNAKAAVTEDYVYITFHHNKYSDRFYISVSNKSGSSVIAKTTISTPCTSVVAILPITQEKILAIVEHSSGRSVCELTCNFSSGTITLTSTNSFDNSNVYFFQAMEETEEEIIYIAWRGLYIIPYNKTTGLFGTSVQQPVAASSYLYCSAFRGKYGNQYIYSLPYREYGAANLKRFWYQNRTLINALSEQGYETQVRKTTKTQFDGVAKTDGEGAPEYVEKEVEVTKTGNMFPTSDWVVNETNCSTSDGFIVELSDSNISKIPSVFDNNTETFLQSSSRLTNWIKMKLPKAIKITKIETRISSYNTGVFTSAVIQGSNDDADDNGWIDLYTITAEQESLTEIALSNTDYYQYYRIFVTMPVSMRYNIFEWQTSEYIEKEIQQIPSTEHKDKVNIYTLSEGGAAV